MNGKTIACSCVFVILLSSLHARDSGLSIGTGSEISAVFSSEGDFLPGVQQAFALTVDGTFDYHDIVAARILAVIRTVPSSAPGDDLFIYPGYTAAGAGFSVGVFPFKFGGADGSAFRAGFRAEGGASVAQYDGYLSYFLLPSFTFRPSAEIIPPGYPSGNTSGPRFVIELPVTWFIRPDMNYSFSVGFQTGVQWRLGIGPSARATGERPR